MFKNILKLANIYNFYCQAGFASKKQIKQNIPDKTVFSYVSQNLEPFGKYFPIVWDKLETENLTKPETFETNRLKINETIDDAKNTLKYFEKINHHLDIKDFNQYKSFDELNSIVQQKMLDVAAERQQKSDEKREDKKDYSTEVNPGDSTKIYEDENKIVYRVNSKSGANSLAGNDTTWCVTKLGQSYYEQYTSSNLIFYFVIDKNLPPNDPHHKVAIRVMKDQFGDIEDIRYTNKMNDSDDRDPNEIEGYNNFQQAIVNDAENQPESLLSKVTNGRAAEEEKYELWDSYHSASIAEKKELGYTASIEKFEKFKDFENMLNHTFTLDEVNNMDLKSLDAATLEKIVRDVYDENLYEKLIKLNLPPVTNAIARRTANPIILSKLVQSDRDELLSEVVKNKNINKKQFEILKNKFENSENLDISDLAASPFVSDKYIIDEILNNPEVKTWEKQYTVDKLGSRPVLGAEIIEEILKKQEEMSMGYDFMERLVENPEGLDYILNNDDKRLASSFIKNLAQAGSALGSKEVLNKLYEYLKNNDIKTPEGRDLNDLVLTNLISKRNFNPETHKEIFDKYYNKYYNEGLNIQERSLIENIISSTKNEAIYNKLLNNFKNEDYDFRRNLFKNVNIPEEKLVPLSFGTGSSILDLLKRKYLSMESMVKMYTYGKSKYSKQDVLNRIINKAEKEKLRKFYSSTEDPFLKMGAKEMLKNLGKEPDAYY